MKLSPPEWRFAFGTSPHASRSSSRRPPFCPWSLYGVVSILSLQQGTRDTVVAGNLNVAARAAEEIRRYISGHAEILKALGADLQDTGLEPWQKERILRNYVLQFREFREVTLFDETGAVVTTSRVGPPRVTVPKDPAVTFDGVSMSPDSRGRRPAADERVRGGAEAPRTACRMAGR